MTGFWSQYRGDEQELQNIIWDTPERRDLAGRVLIIGGNIHSFAAPARAYEYVKERGAGNIRVIMPDALKKTVSKIMPEVEYAPSTASGGFSIKAYESCMQHATWAQGILLAGDVARSSETTIALDRFISHTNHLMVITKDALDLFLANPKSLTDRNNTIIVASLSQLQKIGMSLQLSKPLKLDMGILQLAEWLHLLTQHISAQIITQHNATIFFAYNGQVMSKSHDIEPDSWRLETAARAVVAALHHPNEQLLGLVALV